MATLRSNLATSGEVIKDFQTFYGTALARAPSAAELQGNEGALASGTSLSTVESWVAYSNEAAGRINWLYQQELGRLVDAASLGWAEYQLWQGATLNAIESILAYSTEIQTDATSCLTGLGVTGTSLPTFLSLAEANLSSGQNVAACVANLVVNGAVDNIVTQIDIDLSATVATIAHDISQVRLAIAADMNSFSATYTSWSQATGLAAYEVMKFIGNDFIADISGGKTTLTQQQQDLYATMSTAALKNGTAIPPAGVKIMGLA